MCWYTQDEAKKNGIIREEVAQHPTVQKWFRVFVMEKGAGKVSIDVVKASEHVKHVLTEMRRGRNKDKVHNFIALDLAFLLTYLLCFM